MTTQKRGHEWRFSIVLFALVIAAFMLVSSAAAADAGPKFKGFGGTGPYPVANFTANQTTGVAPFTVQFTNTSESIGSSISAFSWDFNNGNFSTEKNPIVTFTEPGTYNVSLRIDNATGWNQTFSGLKPYKSVNPAYTMPFIVVSAPSTAPDVDFTWSPNGANSPLDFPITFTATNSANGPVVEYRWNFGDGTVKIGKVVSHKFPGGPREQNVTLTAKNAAGFTSQPLQKTINLVDLTAPKAGFVANKTLDDKTVIQRAPLAVGFTDNRTAGPGETYEWNFGDGSPAVTTQDAQHKYLTAGNFTVTQKITNAKGTSTASRFIVITLPTAATAGFTATAQAQSVDGTVDIPASAGITYSAPVTVVFSISNAQANGATSWSWDFGDGSQPDTKRNTTHTYEKAGSFVVTLSATNVGGSGQSYAKINVTQPGIALSIPAINNTIVYDGQTYNGPDQLVVGEPISFGNVSVGNPTSFRWVFSDNLGVTYDTKANTTRTFTSAGTYYVIFTASTTLGGISSIAHFTVLDAPIGTKPEARFYMTSQGQNVTDFIPVTLPALVNFTSNSTNKPTSHQWFINGNLVAETATFSHEFKTEGIFEIRLLASNSNGTGTKQAFVLVSKPVSAPVSKFNATPESPQPTDVNVQFRDLSEGYPDAWVWNFGDGTNSTQQHPSHIYQKTGNYTVTLRASNSAGFHTSSMVYVVTELGVPEASFEAKSPTAVVNATSANAEIKGPIPFTVTFTDTSTMRPTSFLWRITGTGVDVTKTTNTFNYTFNNPGKYSVQLTVYNEKGQDVIYKSAFVNVTSSAPAPNFTWTPTSPVKGQAVQFTDTTLYGPTGWSWSFGDGGLSSIQNPSHTYANAGTYTVTLTTWNSVNGAKTVSKTITVADLAPPVANFTWSPEEPKVGDLVNFTDSSTNNPTSWTWVIENTQYNVQNPAVTFTTPGVKIAFLIATNAAGSSAAKLVQINVAEAPVTVTPTPEVPIVADFTMDTNTGVAPLAVQFVSTSTGPYTSLDWTILLGEDEVDTMVGETPSFTFANPGTYTVLLEASNSGTGEVATKEQTVTVTETPVTTITTTTTTQTPIGGNQPFPSAHVMPGRVEAEDYDVTAGYPAYSDTTAANEGGAYRQDAVDIEVGGSNYNVGWIRPTEFLTYSVDVPTGAAGAYTIAFRMANPSGAKSFNVFVDGVSVGTVNLPATGSFNTWTTVQTPSVQMTEGRHVIKVDFPATTSINFDYMDIQGGTPVTTTTTTTVVTTITTAQPTTGGATFTAAPIPVKKSSLIRFTVTPAPGKTIKSAWWTFDKAGHYNTWNSRNINPSFYYPAVGTYTPLVILTYTDGTTQTVEKAGYVQVIA